MFVILGTSSRWEPIEHSMLQIGCIASFTSLIIGTYCTEYLGAEVLHTKIPNNPPSLLHAALGFRGLRVQFKRAFLLTFSTTLPSQSGVAGGR